MEFSGHLVLMFFFACLNFKDMRKNLRTAVLMLMEMGMLVKDGFGGEYRGYNMEKAIMSFDIQRGKGSYVL